MIVDEDVHSAYKVTEFIEHHGIKGQKWGFRNTRTTKRGNYRLSGRQRVGVAAAFVLGTPVVAGVVYAILKSNGNKRVSDLKLSEHKKETKGLLAEHGSKPVSTQS